MPHPDDELLSALLDGEVPSSDAAHVDGCAECQNRLRTLQHAVSTVAAAVTPPSAHLREASLAIAMNTASKKPATRDYVARWKALPAVAALMFALAVGGMVISQMGSGNDATNTAQDNAAQDEALSPGGGVAEDSPFSAMAGADAGPYQAGDIGAIDDIAAVFERSSSDLAASRTQRAEMAAALPCPVEIAGRTLWQALLSFKNEAAVAYLVETETGTVMQILRQTGCAVLESRAF